ncbi:hypothetical protein RYH73_01330 [Olivibacter sp. CPCC 100613]|uniref:hypothetical protein n=1 Tax=Olivibacter sp. CPCC 100613 TaxID=3079931 RepID=UPI002FFB6DA6
MIANAWYTVNYFNVSFGQQDLIQDAVRQIKEIEGITIDAPKPLIKSRLVETDNPLTHKLLFHFDKQVPHWFLSPWYPKSDRNAIYQYSQEGLNKPMYHLHKDRIVIQEEWFEYLGQHLRIVKDYTYWNLTLHTTVPEASIHEEPFHHIGLFNVISKYEYPI